MAMYLPFFRNLACNSAQCPRGLTHYKIKLLTTSGKRQFRTLIRNNKEVFGIVLLMLLERQS